MVAVVRVHRRACGGPRPRHRGGSRY